MHRLTGETTMRNDVIDLVNAAGVNGAAVCIADALALMVNKYGVDLATVLEGIANTENGNARFTELMAIANKAVG
jgi:hypothetical protein